MVKEMMFDVQRFAQINNSNADTVVSGTGDADTIVNSYGADNVSIDAGAGSDSVRNIGSYVTINAGDGNDTISNGGTETANDHVTIIGGAGDDSIINHVGESVVFQYANGDGNDTITGFNSTSTLSITGGDYSTQVSGNNIIVTVGDGAISLVGAASLSSVNITGNECQPPNPENEEIELTEGNDSLENPNSNVIIYALGGNDTVYNHGSYVTIIGGDGWNSIRNEGSNVLIQGGADADKILNYFHSNVTISGREGDDVIYNQDGNGVSVDGGEGDDTIENGGSSVTIDGGAGGDFIRNSSDPMMSIYGAHVAINGGDGNDTICNEGGDYASINGGKGNDTISNIATKLFVVYNSGDGNDTIQGFNATSTLQIGGGSGTYSKETVGSDIIVTVGDGIISLVGAASLSSVNIDGNLVETVSNSDNNVTLTGTDGSDSIVNGGGLMATGGDSVTINTGDGNDTIVNGSSSNNTTASDVVIDAGAGDDKVFNSGDNSSINAGDGNDLVRNNDATNVTIIGGTGDDTIENLRGAGMVFIYNSGDGNDTLYGFNDDDTIVIASGTYSTNISGNNIVVNVGTNSIILEDAASVGTINIVSSIADVQPVNVVSNSSINSSVAGTEGRDSIKNTAENVTITAGAGNDTIESGGPGVYVDGGVGNDSIWNFSVESTISGGDGNDTINNGNKASISGGAGDDVIYSSGDGSTYSDGSTINGGSGNDVISLSSNSRYHVIEYNNGDGNDTIYGFHDTSTLKITGGSYSTAISGDDVIVTVGSGKITLKDAASLSTYNISALTGTDGNDSINNSLDAVTINALGGNDSIKNGEYGSSEVGVNVIIDSGDGNDLITNFASNVTLRGGGGSDYIENDGCDGADSLNFGILFDGGDGDDRIVNINGNSSTILGGNGNDEISSGWFNSINGGAGNDTIYSGLNDTIEGGSGNDYIHEGIGLVYVYSSGNDTILNFDNWDTLVIVDNYSIEHDDNDNTVIRVEGKGSITLQDCSAETINVVSSISDAQSINVVQNFYANTILTGTAGNDYISNSTDNASINSGAGNDVIASFGNNSTVRAGDGNDSVRNWGDSVTIDLGNGNDTLETWNSFLSINGGAGNDVIYNYNDSRSATVNGGDGNDTISGCATVDGGAGNDKIRTDWISNGSINSGNGDDTIEDGTNAGYSNKIEGGKGNDYIQNSSTSSTINGGEGSDTIENIGANVSINGGADDDYIYNEADNVTINGGEGDNSIHNGNPYLDSESSLGHNVKINTGSGNDFIRNNHGTNVQINSGAGDDLIHVAVASDVTVDMGDGNDTIWNDSDKVSINGGDGNDFISSQAIPNKDNVTLDGGEGNDTIKNESNYSKLIGGAGNDYFYTNGDNSTLDGGDGADFFQNGTRASLVAIYGGAGADRIYNYGNSVLINAGDDNDIIQNSGFNTTIEGGKGNDSVYNGEAGMVYVYRAGDGDDFISGFGILETLVISGAEFTTTNSNGNVIVQVGTNKITLEGAASLPEVNIVTSLENISPVNVISNEDSNVSINGKASSNWIRNYADNTTITGGASNDDIYNSGKKVSINGSGGNDQIRSYADDVTICAGNGKDIIVNSGANVLIDYVAGDGNDTVYGFNETSTLRIGNGSGTYSAIKNGSDVIVYVGDGTITLKGASYLPIVNIDGVENRNIALTAGNDTYNNTLKNITISGLGGNDLIQNGGDWGGNSYWGGEKVTIAGGDGDDTILNLGGHYSSISGGNGNDCIRSNGANSGIIIGGDGKDTVLNSSDNINIDGEAGDDVINNSGTNATINGGAGNDTIENSEDGAIIDGGAGADSVSNSGGLLTINGGADNDTILNRGNTVTIEGGTGDDYVYNSYGASISVDGGSGNDSIENANGHNLTISGGDGNDYVLNSGTGYDMSIGGGADNDYIENYGREVTINGGLGNDSISLGTDASNNLIQYLAGDGNDVIYGFKYNSTLQIGGGNGSYSAVKNGSDIIVTVGNGKITLVGAASLSTVNIAGTDKSTPDWTLSGTTATYGTWNSTLATVSGVKTFNGLAIDTTNKKVTVPAAALNQKTVTISDGYTLALGSDVTKTSTKVAGFDGSAYKTAETIAGYKLANNQIRYVAASGGDTLFTLTNATITNAIAVDTSKKTVTLTAANLNKKNITVDGGYTLALDKSYAPAQTKAAGFEGSAYKTATISDGYTASGKTINYVAASGGETLFTLTNATINDSINVDTANKTVTLTASNLNKKNVTVDGEYTLALDKSYAPSQTKSAGFDGSAYKTATISDGYTASGKTISYVVASGGQTLFTLKDATITDAVNVDTSKKTVTLTAANLNKKNVTVAGDYTLALDKSYEPSQTKAAGFDGNAYKAATISDGYTASGKTISYIAASGGETLFTLTNATMTNAINVDTAKKTVTLTAANLNKKNVTVDGDYILALDKDYAPVIGGNWNFKNSAATYNQTTSDGYSCDGKSITYHETASTDLVTLTGVKATKGLALNNKIVTVAASALGTNNVTISDGYTMTLASDVPAVSTTKAWSLSGTTATYKESNTKGYTLATNKKSVTYTKAANKTLVTVKGVKSKDGLKVNGNVVTLSKKSLSTNKVTVSNGYTLKLAEDVPITSTKNAWSLSGTTATYKQTTTAGYDVATDEKSVTYTKAANKTLVTVKGVKAAKGLALNDKVVTVSKAALGTTKVTAGNGYTFKLNSDVAIASNKSAWNLSGTTATYVQTTTTGYELASDEKSITYTKAASKTLATVKGVKDKKGLKLNDKIITVSKAALGTNKVTVSNGYTLKLGSDVAVVDSKSAWSLSGSTATYKQTATAGYTLADNAITYSKAANKTLITVKGVKSKDGLKVNDNIVTVSKKALGTGKVTISGTGYKLALNSDVPVVRTTKDWNLSGTTATYKQTATAGYTLVNNSIVYSKAASNNLVTVKGVKAVKGLTLNDKTLTVAKASLGTDKITVSNGYTLKLDSDVTVADSKGAWNFKSKTATYRQTATAGYTLADNSITYSKAVNKTLVSVKGVKAKKGLALNNKIVTVSKAALGKDKVTISNGYTLKLGKDVTKSSTTTAWNLKGSTATYKQSTTAGYTLADNSITYSKAANTTLVTVKGVKKIKGLALDGKVVTVSKAALGTDKVTISKGYTLKLGSDVTKSSTNKSWSLDKTTATYTQSTTAGYTLADNTITYSKKSAGTLATVKGVKKTKGLSVKNNVVTLKKAALSKNVSVSGTCEFNFAKDYKNASVTGSAAADTIKVLGSAITVTGGKGNDVITSSGKKNIFVYADGDGKDVIADFSATDKIKITKGTAKVTTSGADVLVKVGKGSIKLTGAAGQKISIVDAKGKEKSYSTSAAEVAWFLEDDNNFSTDNQLDDLVETKNYSSVQLDTSDNLLKENSFITYSKK